MQIQSDTDGMALALEWAAKGMYITAPNPRIGCVIVRDGTVIGAGHTQAAGQAHAEIQALRDAQARGNDVRGATAYVTLEPCSHYGRTPPCSNALIQAGLGRYGPFILHDGTYANVSDIEEVFDVGINRAVDLLAQKRAGGRGARGAATEPLKDLGAHPETGEPVKVMAGRFGPYVKSGSVNATLPKSLAPADVTMEEAVRLIAERAAKGPSKGKGRKTVQKAAKPKAEKKPAAKKAPAKKKAAARKA